MLAAALTAGVIAAGRGFNNFGTSGGLAGNLETLLGSVFDVSGLLALLVLAALVARTVMLT
jgi:hypothetical protein